MGFPQHSAWPGGMCGAMKSAAPCHRQGAGRVLDYEEKLQDVFQRPRTFRRATCVGCTPGPQNHSKSSLETFNSCHTSKQKRLSVFLGPPWDHIIGTLKCCISLQIVNISP